MKYKKQNKKKINKFYSNVGRGIVFGATAIGLYKFLKR